MFLEKKACINISVKTQRDFNGLLLKEIKLQIYDIKLFKFSVLTNKFLTVRAIQKAGRTGRISKI